MNPERAPGGEMMCAFAHARLPRQRKELQCDAVWVAKAQARSIVRVLDAVMLDTELI